jgi:hypothetical protein
MRRSRKILLVVLTISVAMLVGLGSLLGLGSGPRRSVAGPNFACAVVLNTYGICLVPPTNDL